MDLQRLADHLGRLAQFQILVIRHLLLCGFELRIHLGLHLCQFLLFFHVRFGGLLTHLCHG